jgi:hypothetical protein
MHRALRMHTHTKSIILAILAKNHSCGANTYQTNQNLMLFAGSEMHTRLHSRTCHASMRSPTRMHSNHARLTHVMRCVRWLPGATATRAWASGMTDVSTQPEAEDCFSSWMACAFSLSRGGMLGPVYHVFGNLNLCEPSSTATAMPGGTHGVVVALAGASIEGGCVLLILLAGLWTFGVVGQYIRCVRGDTQSFFLLCHSPERHLIGISQEPVALLLLLPYVALRLSWQVHWQALLLRLVVNAYQATWYYARACL